jgi:hypothetical protein
MTKQKELKMEARQAQILLRKEFFLERQQDALQRQMNAQREAHRRSTQKEAKKDTPIKKLPLKPTSLPPITVKSLPQTSTNNDSLIINPSYQSHDLPPNEAPNQDQVTEIIDEGSPSDSYYPADTPSPEYQDPTTSNDPPQSWSQFPSSYNNDASRGNSPHLLEQPSTPGRNGSFFEDNPFPLNDLPNVPYSTNHGSQETPFCTNKYCTGTEIIYEM